MDKVQDGAGAETPAQDAALKSLAVLLEAIADDARDAWLRDGPGDEEIFSDCARRAETVVRCVIGLPSVSLHGADAKTWMIRSGSAMALLPLDLIKTLSLDSASDMERLRAPTEGAGHA